MQGKVVYRVPKNFRIGRKRRRSLPDQLIRRRNISFLRILAQKLLHQGRILGVGRALLLQGCDLRLELDLSLAVLEKYYQEPVIGVGLDRFCQDIT